MAEVVGESCTNDHQNDGCDLVDPLCVIVLGMAGSGKTSLMGRLALSLSEKNTPYMINLDPAVLQVPYPVQIDIRDTVKYKEVMKQYSLGPNGAIMTSLNLFVTKFNQVVDLISKRKSDYQYVLIDTPGQIEVFNWSASGSIVTESLASTFPTVVLYVMDIARSTSPTTFMSNMLYACSILYKTRLPFVVAMNKIDIVHHEFAERWMKDFEAFQTALDDCEESTYIDNLTRSLSLVLDDFYVDLKTVGVSAVTGEGLDKLKQALDSCRTDYATEYRPMYEKMVAAKHSTEVKEQTKRLKRDLKLDKDSAEQNVVISSAVGDLSDDTDSEEDDRFEVNEEFSFRRFMREQKSGQS